MRLVFWLKATAALAGMLVLTGCPGEKSDPQPQQATPRVESSGTLTDGVVLREQSIVAKGAAGPTRSTRTDSSGAFTVNMADLTGPYLFANTQSTSGDPDLILLTSVSTKVGPTNVTPLTTLLTAQVMGVTPATAFEAFGTTQDKDQVTEDNLRTAQADLTAFLQDALGIEVKSGTSSFVDTAFKTDAGDPMYDTILALNAKMAADGTTLEDIAARVATGAQACLAEKIQIGIGGQQKKFCPVSKSNVPEEADTTILDYTFRDISNNVLLVKVRDDTVLSANFTTAANVSYSCIDTACSGISLGAESEDESRTLVFGSLALTANGDGALLDGTLVGPPPSIEMPVLPCTDNRYFVILSTHRVIGDCINPNAPLQYPASRGLAKGHDRLAVTFEGAEADTGTMSIVVDRTTFAAIYLYFYVRDPQTNEVTKRFVCYAEACTGVTWGAPVNDNSKGPTVVLRTITLDNTPLVGMDNDANPTGETAVVKMSALTFFAQTISNPAEKPPLVYPPLVDCDPSTDTVSATGPEGEFNLCMPQNGATSYRGAFDQGEGYLLLQYTNDAVDRIQVTLLNGALYEARVVLASTKETFVCTPPNCSGLTVSGPDPAGGYVVAFSNTVLRVPDVVTDPPQHPRTLTLTSGDLILPPP